MASVVISMESDVSRLTDRELIQTYIAASELHDHLAGDSPQPQCVTVLWDELHKRGYPSPMLCDLKARL